MKLVIHGGEPKLGVRTVEGCEGRETAATAEERCDARKRRCSDRNATEEPAERVEVRYERVFAYEATAVEAGVFVHSSDE